jgi:hypothetical protein
VVFGKREPLIAQDVEAIFMSVHVSSYVWKNSKSVGTDRVVLLAIADMANDEGECFPGIKRLAARANVTERSVQNSLKRLMELGELDIDYKSSKHGTNVFRVVKQTSPGGEADFTRGGEADFTRVVKRASPNTSVEPSEVNNNTLAALNDMFETFWKKYPRTGGTSKEKARAAWMRISPDRDLFLQIGKALVLYIEFWEADNTEPKFIPHPSTWLNDGRWQNPPTRDMIDQAKNKKGSSNPVATNSGARRKFVG